MISVSNDVNMRRIVTQLLTRKFGHLEMRLYGLMEKPGRPDIVVETMGTLNDETLKACDMLSEAGLVVRVDEECSPDEPYEGLRIGFNRRVRSDIAFCRRLAMMLLHAVNRTLRFDKSIKIKRLVPIAQGPVPPAPVNVVLEDYERQHPEERS